MKNAVTLYFWGRGTSVPERVQIRAARNIIRQDNLSARPKEIAPFIKFSPIAATWFPLRHRVEIKDIPPDALLIKKQEGRDMTVALISENILPAGTLKEDIHLVLGDLKGFGKLNKIYGKEIVDWLKAKIFRSIDEKSRKIGFMYAIYGDEIGITSRPGISGKEIGPFLNSLTSDLESELSGHGAAILANFSDRARQLLGADERVEILGGYFGVNLMVFDARGKDIQHTLKEIIVKTNQALSNEKQLRAELYDPDFNRARIWAPKIHIVSQSLNDFLEHEKDSGGNPDEIYQKAMKRMNAMLKPPGKEKKLPRRNYP